MFWARVFYGLAPVQETAMTSEFYVENILESHVMSEAPLLVLMFVLSPHLQIIVKQQLNGICQLHRTYSSWNVLFIRIFPNL